MSKNIAVFLILALVFIVCAGIFYSYAANSYQAAVADISGEKYSLAAKEALSKAEKSIDMAMYFVSFNPADKNSEVAQLVEELVNAHKRGVKVKVILDQNANFEVEEPGGGWERKNKNDALFSYLKSQGIEVYYDDMYVLTHAKAIVIDEETCIIGSANWSKASLTKNWEISCLIKSKDLAKEILADFAKIELDPSAQVSEEEKYPATRISSRFINDPALAARMVSDTDDSAFNLYLYLLRKFDGNLEGKVEINYEEIVPFFGADQKVSYYVAQQRLQQGLRRLERNYHLIKRVMVPPQIKYVILLDYPSQASYAVPLARYISLPDTYWRYGWHKTLTLAEKYCYLINLYKTGFSSSPVWSFYATGLHKAFHIGRKTMSTGMQGLRRLNIIEIDYPPFDLRGGEFKTSGPAYFRLLGLYSSEELKAEKEKLAQKYGQERFDKAQVYAGLVYKSNDARIIEEILNLTDEYTPEQIDFAFQKVADKAPYNTKRVYNYVIGTLQSMAREGELAQEPVLTK